MHLNTESSTSNHYEAAAAQTTRGADHIENTSQVIATQLVHWCDYCCLVTSYLILFVYYLFRVKL
jgi:hypothetical protein